MHKVIILVVGLLCLVHKSNAQLDSISISKLATAVKDSLEGQRLSGEEFGPSKLMFANLMVFTPGNNKPTEIVRSLLLAKKFKNEQQLFEWLLPLVNKQVLTLYLYKGGVLSGEDAIIIPALAKAVCPCLEIVHKVGIENIFTDSAARICISNVWSDTALLSSYLKKIELLKQEQLKVFLSTFLKYGQINCDSYFNSLTSLSMTEVPKAWSKYWLYYEYELFGYVTAHQSLQDRNLLRDVFTTWEQYKIPLQAIDDIYKTHDKKSLRYSLANILETNIFERKSSFIVEYVNGKGRILGQAVYEIGIDKPLLYIRNMVFYPRLKLQNIENLERYIPPPQENER